VKKTSGRDKPGNDRPQRDAEAPVDQGDSAGSRLRAHAPARGPEEAGFSGVKFPARLREALDILHAPRTLRPPAKIRLELRLNLVVVPAGGSAIVTTKLAAPADARAIRLVIEATDQAFLFVDEIKLGNKLQTAFPGMLPAMLFAAQAVEVGIAYGDIKRGERASVVVHNSGSAAQAVEGAWWFEVSTPRLARSGS